jgi:hypothetical protein
MLVPTKFPLHTPDSAPEASKPLLAQVESAFGFVPNLTAMLAESPADGFTRQQSHAERVNGLP